MGSAAQGQGQGQGQGRLRGCRGGRGSGACPPATPRGPACAADHVGLPYFWAPAHGQRVPCRFLLSFWAAAPVLQQSRAVLRLAHGWAGMRPGQ